MRKSIIIAFISIAVAVGIAWATNGPYPSVDLYWYENFDPTTAGGVTAPLKQLLVRTDVPSIYYKSGTANTAWTLIGDTTGTGGTVTSVACGNGMSCTPEPITTTGTVSIDLTPTTCSSGKAEITTASDGTSTCQTFFQSGNFPTTTCPGGQAEIATANDGTSTCAAFGSGSVTSVTCSTGLSCTPNPITSTGNVALNITPTTCAAGMAEVATTSDGTSTCAAFGSSSFTNSAGPNVLIKSDGANGVTSAETDDGTNFEVAGASIFQIVETNGNTSIGGTLDVVGGAMNMHAHQINNLADPTLAQDAATKNYVNNKVSGTIGYIPQFIGTNTIGNSLIAYTGSSYLVGGAGFQIGTTGNEQNLMVNGVTTGNGGLTNDYQFDPNGLSYFDSVVGVACGHGSGTDETLAIGFVPTCSAGLQGSLDVNTNGNTIISKDSAAVHVMNSDTVNTGSSPRASYGLQVINQAGRGTGTGALTAYGIWIDNPGNAQTNYSLFTSRGDAWIDQGALTVHTGATSLKGLTATTIHATAAGQFDTSLTVTGNIQSTTGSVTAGIINWNNSQMFGGSSENDWYMPSASNQDINIDASGAGAVRINTNSDGITNSGTGGLIIGPGNNSSLFGTVLPGTGQIEDRGTLPAKAGCGTSPVLIGGAYSGRIQTDTGATTCVLTFAASLHGAESCIVVDEAGIAVAFSHTSAALSITAVATHTYDYDCRGH